MTEKRKEPRNTARQSLKDMTLLASIVLSIILMVSYWHLWKERFPFFNAESTVLIYGAVGENGEPNEIQIKGRGLKVEVRGDQWDIDGLTPPHKDLMDPPNQDQVAFPIEPLYRQSIHVGSK